MLALVCLPLLACDPPPRVSNPVFADAELQREASQVARKPLPYHVGVALSRYQEQDQPIYFLVSEDLLHTSYRACWSPPCVFDGPVNGAKFLARVTQVLSPTLRPGDVVVLDNLGSHKGKAVRAAIRAVGAKLLFLPPYSPDLNPIEQVFAKLKHWLRRVQARSTEQTNEAVGRILNRFKPTECAAYFANAGYAST